MKKTRKNYEQYLNSIGNSLDDDAPEFIMGGKRRRGKLGTMMRKYDPIQFEVGYNEWKRNY